MRTMFDALVLPSPAPRADVWAGYLRSPGMRSWWSAGDWARAQRAARWLLPIAGYSPASPSSPADDASAQRAEINLLLGGFHCARMLDVEQNVANLAASSGYPWEWAQGVERDGDYPIVYCSGSSAHLFAGLNLCVAEWNDTRHMAPGAVATQYASPATDPALNLDISVVADAVPLLDTGAPPAMPTQALEIGDRVFYKPGQPDRDDWAPVAVQIVNGALFVFNATANPFHEGTLQPFGAQHVLNIGQIPGEKFVGLTDRTPAGALHADGLEALSLLPDGTRAPRHVLTWA